MESEDEFKYGIEYTINDGDNWIKLGEVDANRQFVGQTLNTYALNIDKVQDYKTVYRWYSLNQTGKRVQTVPVANPACEQSTFLVYPNPFNTNLNISFDLGSHSDKNIVLEILDLNGKSVYKQEFNLGTENTQTGQINVSEFEHLSNGIYQLRIGGNDTILLNEKIVKTN